MVCNQPDIRIQDYFFLSGGDQDATKHLQRRQTEQQTYASA